MFRDSRGVVHTVSSADPLEDLPPGAARALQAALLQPAAHDLGSVLERCDAVQELLERWQDAFFSALPDEVDVEEEERWAAEAGMSLQEVEAQYEDEDDDDDDEPDLEPLDDEDDDDDEDLDELVHLTAPDEHDPRRLLPDDLVAVLERELLLLPLRVRLEALVAAGDLVSTWSDLVADQEKLLGHLVLAHGEPQQAVAHEALAARHAVLHTTSGPGHAPVA